MVSGGFVLSATYPSNAFYSFDLWNIQVDTSTVKDAKSQDSIKIEIYDSLSRLIAQTQQVDSDLSIELDYTADSYAEMALLASCSMWECLVETSANEK